MAKWLAGIIATMIAVVVLFWLTEDLRSPAPSQLPSSSSPGDSPASAQPESNAITVRCSTIPRVLQAGSQAELIIQATTPQNTPVFEAEVRVDSDAGVFPSAAGTAVSGRTDYGGSFRTMWSSPSPAQNIYVMRVAVSKQDFVAGRGECRIIIR